VLAEVKDSQYIVIYKVVGDWTSSFKFLNCLDVSVLSNAEYAASSNKLNFQNNAVVQNLDVTGLKLYQKRVRPLEKQSNCESRMLWREVIEALKQGDIGVASTHRLSVNNNF
jgi:hypothetical protein